MHQSHLIIQMVFGIFISLGIFYAILCTSEYDTIFPPRMGRRLRAATPVLVPAPARGRSLNGAGVRK
jgi:hypothetical protein